ncbi:hypothetical protein BN1049_02124 [Pseudomonas saudimassiliensis]|uniref:Phosphodiesterase n=1 Tax=Pseudomonas saudimassiliensis TaxID=1461581 RepID=A0A078MGU5_9PSED|nr:hypothetical protein [Pseudomonas saudimassiliensis]CEA05515.1 hypothetical protein BN1049_02124 [Pseudomonas saudimassiliensis]CEF27178.1 hypothetical protein BN1049_02124 [Pseudomonas saudimassiliensis]
MKYTLPLFLATSLLTVTGMQAQADTLTIPVGQQAAQQGLSLPQRGAAASTVRQQHGEPVTRHAAVGTPPISRWDYDGFSVYFEHDKVVHSVRQHKPAH